MSEITKVNEKVNFTVEEVVSYMIHVERLKRYEAEVKIFFILKQLINVINGHAQSLLLKLVASGYKRTVNHFQIALYTADSWSLHVIRNLGRYIEAWWKHELKTKIVYKFNRAELFKDVLYVILFEIESEHPITTDMIFFYNN